METGGAASAYGASLAGGQFDFWAFIKQPQTILRLLSWETTNTCSHCGPLEFGTSAVYTGWSVAQWLFAIVVFGTITGEGFVNAIHSFVPKCMFNENDTACHYAVGVGVLGFLACVAFLVIDAYFPHISNANERKHIVIADMAFSGLWAGLWFVCFCVLAHQWSLTTHPEHLPVSAARAAIAFSFFSIFSWGLLVFFALRRFLLGVSNLGQNYEDSAPPMYPSTTPERFQQAPFTINPEPQEESGYEPPAPVF